MPARAVQIPQFRVRHEPAGHTEPIAPNGGYRDGGVSEAITESSSPSYPRRALVADGSLIP